MSRVAGGHSIIPTATLPRTTPHSASASASAASDGHRGRPVYLYARQADGHEVWTSPLFFTRGWGVIHPS